MNVNWNLVYADGTIKSIYTPYAIEREVWVEYGYDEDEKELVKVECVGIEVEEDNYDKTL